MVDHVNKQVVKIHYGTYAEMTALIGREGDEFIVNTGTNAGNKYEYRGATAGWALVSAGNGAASVANVSEGAVGSEHDRLYTGNPSTRQKFTWAAGQGPKTIRVRVIAAKIVTAAQDVNLKVCFDAENDAIANANLAQTGEVAADLRHKLIERDDGWRRFDFSAPLQRMDFLTNNGTVIAVRVEGEG